MTDGWYFASLLGWALAWMALVRPLRLGQALLCAVCGMLLTAYLGVIVLPLRQGRPIFSWRAVWPRWRWDWCCCF